LSGKSEPDFAGCQLSASVRRRNNTYEAFVAVVPEPAGLALLVASGALAVGDRLVESNESFLVNLSSPTHASISDAQGIGTIRDDEPRISISDVTKYEAHRTATRPTR
jgi:hypothetical protein